MTQTRTIESSTATELILDRAWDGFTLEGTCTYEIIDGNTKPTLVGTITSAPAGESMTDASGDFDHYGSLAGAFVRVTGSDGLTQTRTILSNTATVLTLDRAWESFPAEGPYTYEIIDGYNRQTGDVVTRLGTDQLVEFGQPLDTPHLNSYAGPAGGAIYGMLDLSTLNDNPSTLTVTEEVFPTANNGLRGLRVWITSGPCAGQSQLILSNTATTLTLDQPWDLEDAVAGTLSRFYVAAFPQDQTDGVLRDPSIILAVNPEIGGTDTIYGYDGNDRIFGGAGGDTIYGGESETSADGDDVIFGDLGQIKYELDLNGKAGETVVDMMNTTYDNQGGVDIIYGSGGNDTILGGASDDTIHGNSGTDRILGDSGVFDFVQKPAETDGAILTSFETTHPEAGGVDTIFGDSGNDLIIGGTKGDTISGGSDADIAFGDYAEVILVNNNYQTIRVTDNTQGGSDTIYGNSGDDLLVGGAAGDNIDGDEDQDFIIGDNVRIDLRTVTTDPRYRTLSGTTIYDAEGNPQVTASEQLKPGTQPAWAAWQVTLLNNTSADQTAALNNIGNDYIAGGAGDDTIFGQLGDDTIQGDGSIDSKVSGETAVGAWRTNGTLTVNASFEASRRRR